MDWKNTIADLQHSGLTQAQIAKEIGVGQSTVAELLSGAQKDVKWAIGNRLMALHKKALKRRKSASFSEEPSHA
jgi:DNA transposition AAA+ family ATPase